MLRAIMLTITRVACLIPLLLLASTTSAAVKAQKDKPLVEQQDKPAWEWTAEDRLAARFDPANAEQRRQAYQQSHPQIRSLATVDDEGNTPRSRPMEFSIDGHRNPELFLSHELFDALLSGLTPDETLRGLQRGYYRDVIRSLGYDDDVFWSDLASVTGHYIVIRFKQGNIPSELTCGERYDALEAARRLFGRKQFDRILYTVIAPTMQKSQATFDPNLAVDALRRAEKGCR